MSLLIGSDEFDTFPISLYCNAVCKVTCELHPLYGTGVVGVGDSVSVSVGDAVRVAVDVAVAVGVGERVGLGVVVGGLEL